MSNTTVIEIVARVSDETAAGAASATANVSKLEKAFQRVQNTADGLRRKSNIEMTANLNDNASKGITSILGKGREITGKIWSVTVGMIDKASRGITTVIGMGRQIAGRIWSVTVSLIDKITAPFRGIIKMLTNPIVVMASMAGISLGLKDVMQTGMGFEQNMANIRAVSNMAGTEMDKLGTAIRGMGGEGFALNDISSAAKNFVTVGSNAEGVLEKLGHAMTLSQASGMELYSTTYYLNSIMNKLGGDTELVGQAIDSMAMAAGLAHQPLDNIMSSWNYMGSIVRQAGMSMDEANAAIVTLSDSGYRGTQAGTMFSRMMQDLMTPNSQAAKRALDDLGFSMFDASGNVRPFGEAMQHLASSLDALETPYERVNKLNDIFTVQGLRAADVLLENVDNLSKYISEINAAGDAFDGMGAASGMAAIRMDTLQGAFSRLRGGADALKLAISDRLSPYLRSFVNWLVERMPAIQATVVGALDNIISRISGFANTIQSVMQTQEFQDADFFGRIGILWDEVVAQPFSSWWSSTGKQFFIDKAGEIGQSIGSGLTSGLLTLLGLQSGDALSDGMSIGASFIDGFMESFDGAKIGQAFKQWASENKPLVLVLGIALGIKLADGIIKGIKAAKGIAGALKGVFAAGGIGKGLFGGGGGKGDLFGGGFGGAMQTAKMTVHANMVNVLGGSGKGVGSQPGRTGGRTATGPGKGRVAGLPGGAAGGRLALPAATTGHTVFTKGGVALGTTSSKPVATLAGAGLKMGSGATTIGGAAAAGVATPLAALGAIAGAGRGVYRIGQGLAAESGSRERTERIASGSSALGMVGAGAAAGAGIGSIVPGIGTAVGAVVGAGAGGIASIFSSDAVGSWIADSLDEGGWMRGIGDWASSVGQGIGDWASDVGQGVSSFFTESVPQAISTAREGIGTFFTETVPDSFSNLSKGITGFFIKTVPGTISTAGSYITSFFTETVPDFFRSLWDEITGFFTETVPFAIGYAAGRTVVFFTETVPEFFRNLWDGITNFFTETVPGAIETAGNYVTVFFTETVPEFFRNLWSSITNFFTETVPAAIETAGNYVTIFFTETVPEFFRNLWEGITNFFTENVAPAVETVGAYVTTFFSETVPEFFRGLLDDITNFFTQTIPQGVATIGTGIRTFFTSTLPGFFTQLWSGVSAIVTQAIPGAISQIGSSVTGFFNNIAGQISGAFSSIGSSFSSGFSVGSGGAHAEGGILTRPHIGLVAEDGPEAVIPLGSKRRQRGISLWEQAGEILGMYPHRRSGPDDPGMPEPGDSGMPGPPGTDVTVTIENVSFEVNVDGGSSDVVKKIKDNINDLTDEIAYRLSMSIQESFVNTPQVVGDVY